MAPEASHNDGQLLAAFVNKGDEQAFAVLVNRHSAMVLSVCRGMLNSRSDAEDAAQAVFLALAKKAASLLRNESVAALGGLLRHRPELRPFRQISQRPRSKPQSCSQRVAQAPSAEFSLPRQSS